MGLRGTGRHARHRRPPATSIVRDDACMRGGKFTANKFTAALVKNNTVTNNLLTNYVIYYVVYYVI